MVEDLHNPQALDLLTPCPNARHGLPTNVDKSLPNARLAGCPLAGQMLEFVGKLMGMSLRAHLCLPFHVRKERERTKKAAGWVAVRCQIEMHTLTNTHPNDNPQFPSLVWKRLLGQELTRGDMEAVDTLTCRLLGSVRACGTPEEFDAKFGGSLTFVVMGHDGCVVEWSVGIGECSPPRDQLI